jgi:hypothetical protein
VKVIYIAGAGIGFVPQSNVIDDSIVKSIELNLQNPSSDTADSGEYKEDKINTVPRSSKINSSAVRRNNQLRKIQTEIVAEVKNLEENVEMVNKETEDALVENVEEIADEIIEDFKKDESENVPVIESV